MANVFTHNGIFTVTSLASGDHRTFRVRTQADDARFAAGERVISLLSGPDNNRDYTGFGFVKADTIAVWASKRGGQFDAFAKMLVRLDDHIAAGRVQVVAATKCRRCNRSLTTPASIESGIGPICEGKE